MHFGMIMVTIMAIAILFISMIFSAMSAEEIKQVKCPANPSDISKPTKCEEELEKAHSHATWAALITGLAVFCLVIFIVFYFYTEHKSSQQVGGNGAIEMRSMPMQAMMNTPVPANASLPGDAFYMN